MIIGNVFKNWNKTCYIANKINTKTDDYGNEINEYNKPKKYTLNIQPAGGDFDVTLYGEKVTKVYRAIAPYNFSKRISEGDIAYLEGTTPIEEVVNGDNANYIIDSIRPQNLAVAIYFKKIEK